MHFHVICTISSAEGEDYTVTPPGVYEATFPALTTMNGDTACDTVTIVDDSDLEGLHDFAFSISRASVGDTTLPGIQFNGQLTSVEIEDNEGMKPSTYECEMLLNKLLFGGCTFSYVVTLETDFFRHAV